MKKVIIVANVAKEHVLKFHLPTIQMLKERGWYVDVACAGDDKVPFCDNQFKMRYKRNPVTVKTIEGIFQLHRILKEGEYDVLHCHTPTGGVVARLATLGLPKKPYVIYTAHGFHFFKGAPIINWLIYFPVEWLLGHRTDCLIVINREDYKTARRFRMGMKELRLLHGMGVNKDKFSCIIDAASKEQLKKELKIEEGQIVLTYVAEILKNKNQEILLKVLEELLKQGSPSIKLILVGPCHDGGECQKLTEKMKIENHVCFTGWRSDIVNILGITDIYVASSLREGLGLNLVEAQFMGVPVIASDNRGHREIIENGVNGFLVPARDIQKYVERIKILINNQVIREQFVKNGKKNADKFSMKRIMRQMEEIYDCFR